MTTKETFTIRKAELYAEIEANDRKRAKEFVENELVKIGECNATLMQGQAIIDCPIYLNYEKVGEELKNAGFEVKKNGCYIFKIEW